MEYFFAKKDSMNEVILKRPPDLPPSYHYIASGAYGNVYASGGGTTVLKLFEAGSGEKNLMYAMDEYTKLDALSNLAPEYLPAPCTRIKIGSIPAIQMVNAGNSLYAISKMEDPLTAMEYALCILQSIHFVLLISDEFIIYDMHIGNICVRSRGAAISLKFIDVGLWDDNKNPTLYSGIVQNANALFWSEWGSLWQSRLSREVINSDPILLILKCSSLHVLYIVFVLLS